MKDHDERAMLQLIDERDAAEECLSQMYYIVTGNSPEWSNQFRHAQALEDVADAVSLLKQSLLSTGERSKIIEPTAVPSGKGGA